MLTFECTLILKKIEKKIEEKETNYLKFVIIIIVCNKQKRATLKVEELGMELAKLSVDRLP